MGRSPGGLNPEHFYPRPPRGGRLTGNAPIKSYLDISIHALREEGDTAYQRQESGHTNFYPRPPRGGRPDDVFQLGLF